MVEDTRIYDLDFHPSKFNALICIKLDKIIDQNEKIVTLLERMLEKVQVE